MFDKPDLIYPFGGFLKWGIPKWFEVSILKWSNLDDFGVPPF